MSVRILAVLLVAAGGVSLASGCGGAGPTASTPTPGTGATPVASAQPSGGESVAKAFVRRRGASLVVGPDDRPVACRASASATASGATRPRRRSANTARSTSTAFAT
jgi:hypothetical protein